MSRGRHVSARGLVPFNEVEILHSDKYLLADPRLYLWCQTRLDQDRYHASFSHFTLRSRLPSVDKALWTPESRVLPCVAWKPRPQALAYEVVHAAMHSSFPESQRVGRRGFPRITLLSEALAGGVEFYFDLKLFAKSRRNARCRELLNRGLSRRWLGQDAFAAYRRVVHDQYLISRRLLEGISGAKSVSPATLLPRLLRGLADPRNLRLLEEKDLGNFALHTFRYCGSRSSRKDAELSARTMRKLMEARSLPDFLGFDP